MLNSCLECLQKANALPNQPSRVRAIDCGWIIEHDPLVEVTSFDPLHLATASSSFSSISLLRPAALLYWNKKVSRPWDPV
jgi:hypothetical protein